MKSTSAWHFIGKFILYCITGVLVVVFTNLAFVRFSPSPEFYNKTSETPTLKSQTEWRDYFSATESDVKEGLQKEVLASDPFVDQPTYGLVYLPGFSATRKEITPVVETLNTQLSAPTFFSRWPEHGIGIPKMNRIKSLDDFYSTLDEAFSVGKSLAKNLVFVGTSTGAAGLFHLALKHPETQFCIVALSPLIEFHDPETILLEGPLGYLLTHYFFLQDYTWTPKYLNQENYWHTSYPYSNLHLLASFAAQLRQQDPAQITQPVLILYTESDKVVSVPAIKKFFHRLGSRQKQLIAIDSNDHVIAGDITSPKTTQVVTNTIANFIGKNCVF